MNMNMMEKERLSKRNKSQAKLFKLLAHPARLSILETLRNGEECVCHMEANLGYRQAYLSQQLAVLREAGIIQDRRDGWNIFYRITQPEVYSVLDAAAEMLGIKISHIRIESDDCLCPKCSTLKRD